MSSLLALTPQNLRKWNLLPNITSHKDEHVTGLLLSALHIIPSLPYYLVADSWRLNVLKKSDMVSTTDTDTEFPSTMPSDSYDVEKREIAQEEIENNIEEDEADENLKTIEELTITNETKSNDEISPTTIQTVAQIYDINNVTSEWWEYRAKLQGVASPDGGLYSDYLQDSRIIWHKSYIRYVSVIAYSQNIFKAN